MVDLLPMPKRPPKPLSDEEQRAYDRGFARGECYGVVAGRTEATIVTLASVAALIGAFFVGSWLG